MWRLIILIALTPFFGCSDEGGGAYDAGPISNRGRPEPCPDQGFTREEDGRCVCNNDGACGLGKVCEGGQCLDGCRHGGHCNEDQLCEVGPNAAFGQCVNACPEGDCPDRCDNDRDCVEEEHCDGRFCVPDCANHNACPQGEACSSSGRCAPGCRSAEECGGRSTCEDTQCICQPIESFTVVEINDETDNSGLRRGDELSITIHLPNTDQGLPVGLLLSTQNVTGANFAGSVWEGMEVDANGWQDLEGGGKGAVVTLNHMEAKVTFTARAGNLDQPVRVLTELLMLGPQGSYCAARVPNSKGLANLPLVGASNDLANCADTHGAHMVQLMTAQRAVAISEFGGATRSDLSWGGQGEPLIGPSLHYCVDLLGGGSLPLSSDWRGEAPVAVQGQLLFESFDMGQTERCETSGDCTRPGEQACIDGQCRERLSIATAGNAQQSLRDREHRNAEVESVGPLSCLDRCAIEPVPRDNPAWGAGDMNLSQFLRWGQRTDLRMSLLAVDAEVANTNLFVQTRTWPDWWLRKTCRCGHTTGRVTCGAPSDQGLDAAPGICSEN